MKSTSAIRTENITNDTITTVTELFSSSLERPCNLLQLPFAVRKKTDYLAYHLVSLAERLWQARKDSNLQHPVLETGALSSWSYWPIPKMPHPSLRLFVKSVLPVKLAEFLYLQTRRLLLLVPRRRIVPPLAFTARQRDYLSHDRLYSITLVIVPAPTVRPPSRIAKRSCSSIAIGEISFTSNVTLSPGITISTPSCSVTEPVTSVVRK